MATFGYTFPIPSFATPNQAAWFLTVALIGKTDFSRPLPTTVLLVKETFTGSENTSLGRVKAVGIRAMASRLTAYKQDDFDGAAYHSMPLFSLLTYELRPYRVEGYLNPNAILYLKSLQYGIHKLYLRRLLTPDNLTRYMVTIDPDVEFYMGDEKEVTV